MVTIKATDARASWAGDTGTFTLFRHGPTNDALHVYYRIGGTAVNGQDYKIIGNFASIPAGERTGSVIIHPIDTGLTVTRTVGLQLVPPPMMPPINYVIGLPSDAVIYISPGVTNNMPPMVAITTPLPGASFPAGSDITICAHAADMDGRVRTVEFFAGSRSLGITTNNSSNTDPRNPFCLVWSNAPAGEYALKALATDNDGASGYSAPVYITVGSQPPANYPPVVRISSPPNGAVFPFPTTIPIHAYAIDRDGTVAAVEFFAGTESLGFGSNIWRVISPTPMNCPTNVYLLLWSNAPVGPHVLRAKATDDHGASAYSEPVNISVVLPPPPPPTRPPVVSIVAVDPIAIEGTNCWTWLGLTNLPPTWIGWDRNTCRWFTNCGPKNATFLVRRLGATNDDLTVTYAIRGTATNGVDYVPLPGSVKIPAGERGARMTIIPLDDERPDRNRTVVLSLLPSSTAPLDYVLGYPRTAAALIVDSLNPRPGTRLLSDRMFYLNADGPDGAWYRIEYSTDLVRWTGICTNQVVNGSIDFVDPEAVAEQSRFYRAVPELNPPPQ